MNSWSAWKYLKLKKMLTDRRLRHRDFYVNAIMKGQWLSSQEIEEIQWTKLKNLLHFAYHRTPYYKKIFAEYGLTLNSFSSISDLKKLPLLTRKILQKEWIDLCCPDWRGKKYLNRSGGSTGEPVNFYHDEIYENYAEASRKWTYALCGLKKGERRVKLWGNLRDSPDGTKVVKKGNLLFINTFTLDNALLEEISKLLIEWKPLLIEGYVNSLYTLAQYLLEEEEVRIRPRAVQATAEVLFPSQRKVLERAFQAPVFDRYGSREVSIIGHECERHSGLHIMGFNNIVEIMSDGGIVVTNLNNYVMPFIRYVVGDVVNSSTEECRCGRGFPVMEGVQGRANDVIISPRGKRIWGYFGTLLYQTPGVRKFQVVQESLENLTIRIVKGPDFIEECVDKLREEIQSNCDSSFRIHFEFPEEISPASSGKVKFIISHVKQGG